MMNDRRTCEKIHILLVEDNPGDVRLVREAFKDSKLLNELMVVGDGVEAMAFLRKEGSYANATRPDIVFLDLNLPKKSGTEVLKEIKEDQNLKRIPVIILTTSDLEKDILATYDLHANSYITKPVDFDRFLNVMRQIETFWLTVVKLPKE